MIYSTGSEQRASEAQGGDGGEVKQDTVCAMTVTADLLNVRSGPGPSHEIVESSARCQDRRHHSGA